jgi:hypothetical protein
MSAMRQDRHSSRRRTRKVLACSVTVLVVGSLGTFLYRGAVDARNGARSATTI